MLLENIINCCTNLLLSLSDRLFTHIIIKKYICKMFGENFEMRTIEHLNTINFYSYMIILCITLHCSNF